LGLAACQPVAELWANLSRQSPDDRRAALEQFYFEGIGAFPPVVSSSNFGSDGKGGRIRTGEFVAAPANSGPFNTQGWRNYQFQLAVNCPDGGICTARMIPQALPGTPPARFLNVNDPDPRGVDFRAEFLRQLSGLIGSDPNQFSVNYPAQFLMFESNLTEIGADNKYSDQFQAGMASAEGQQFRSLMQQRLTELGSNLTPEQVVWRMRSQTCDGCHNVPDNVDFGGGVTPPKSFLFAHDGDNLPQFEDGEDGPMSRYGISPALRDVFLPYRLQNLQNFLNTTQSGNTAARAK